MSYIHGFDPVEQHRLVSQAKVLEAMIFEKIDYSGCNNILEIGCGVGAQTEILLNRYPNVHVTGIELSDAQLNTAKSYLSSKFDPSRFSLYQMNAESLTFKSNTFDGVYICWVLEHLSNPQKVVNECYRVLDKNGFISITEVQNNNLYLVPHSDFIFDYWKKYNDLQIKMGGNPFVGIEIGNFLFNAYFNNISVYPNNFLLDNNKPKERKILANYWTNLLLSGFNNLLENKLVKESDKEKLIHAIKSIDNHNGVFHYSCIQGKAIKK